MIKYIINIFFLIIFLPAVCIAGEVNVGALDKANWLNIQTMNFDVLTNAKEQNAVEMVMELEDFYYFLALTLGYEQQNLSEKVAVVLAKNQNTFTSMGMSENHAGVFVKGNNDYAIFARCDGFRSSSEGGSNWGRAVVLHELVHLFLHNSSSSLFALPPWYEEGIAEYFGTYIEGRKKVIIGDMSILGNRFYGMFKVNSEIENIDTESLFKVTKEVLNIMSSSKINEEFMNKFYARSASVVHYMKADPERNKQLFQYLFLLKKGYTVDDAFKSVFNMTYPELDKKVNNYINGKYLVGTAYRLGKGGLEFPEVEYKKYDLSKREAFEFLYARISMLPGDLLNNKDLKKYYSDIEKLYPGLINNQHRQWLMENPVEGNAATP